MSGVFLYLNLVLLHLVNFFVNSLQGCFVGSPEIASAGNLCNFSQHSLINAHLHILHLLTKYSVDGEGGGAYAAYPYRINPNAEGTCNFSCRQRCNLSPVVFAVRQKDDDFAFCVAVLNAVDRCGQAHSYDCTIFEHAYTYISEKIGKHVVVEGQRTLGETFGCKDDQSHPVVGSALNKVNSHFLGRFQSVGFEIHRLHTAGDVQRNHDVDAFGGHVLQLVGALWTCQGGNDHNQRKDAQHKRYMPDVGLPGLAAQGEKAKTADLQGGMRRALLPNVPANHGQQ